jgi:hypothetical protein
MESFDPGTKFATRQVHARLSANAQREEATGGWKYRAGLRSV